MSKYVIISKCCNKDDLDNDYIVERLKKENGLTTFDNISDARKHLSLNKYDGPPYAVIKVANLETIYKIDNIERIFYVPSQPKPSELEDILRWKFKYLHYEKKTKNLPCAFFVDHAPTRKWENITNGNWQWTTRGAAEKKYNVLHLQYRINHGTEPCHAVTVYLENNSYNIWFEMSSTYNATKTFPSELSSYRNSIDELGDVVELTIPLAECDETLINTLAEYATSIAPSFKELKSEFMRLLLNRPESEIKNEQESIPRIPHTGFSSPGVD